MNNSKIKKGDHFANKQHYNFQCAFSDKSCTDNLFVYKD